MGTHKYRSYGRHKAVKGQTTVEFALIAFILFAMVYGIIEVSRLIYVNAAVDNGAREGASYLAFNPPGTGRYDVNGSNNSSISYDTR